MNTKVKGTTARSERMQVVLRLSDVEAVLDGEGYLRLSIPAVDIPGDQLLDFAVDLGTKTPDALVDRLVNAVNEHMVTEFLAGRLLPSHR